jgi:UrcA family protein
MSRFKMKLLASCALLATLASPLSTLAASIRTLDVQPSRVVKFGDLDLNRGAGVEALYLRIKSAAREVCEPEDAAIMKLMRVRFDCRQDAIARAIDEVNSPALTSYYLGKTKTLADKQR